MKNKTESKTNPCVCGGDVYVESRHDVHAPKTRDGWQRQVHMVVCSWCTRRTEFYPTRHGAVQRWNSMKQTVKN